MRELMRLIRRLPEGQQAAAHEQARATIRPRLAERDGQAALDHQRELAAKIAYLRMVTPKHAGESRAAAPGTTYVMRGGKLVEGGGEARGSRAADGSMNMDEAMRRNARDFKRFHGSDKPKKPLFF